MPCGVLRLACALGLALVCCPGVARDCTGDVVAHWSGMSHPLGAPRATDFDIVVRTGPQWPGRLEGMIEGNVVVRDLTYDEMRQVGDAIEEARLDTCAGDVWAWEPSDDLTELALPQAGIGPIHASFGGLPGYDQLPNACIPLSLRQRDEAVRYHRVVRVLRALLAAARLSPARPGLTTLPADMVAPLLLVHPVSQTAAERQPLEVRVLLANRGQWPFRTRPLASPARRTAWLELGVSAAHPEGLGRPRKLKWTPLPGGCKVGSTATVGPGETLELAGTVVLPGPGRWSLAAEATANAPDGYGWLQDPPWLAGTMTVPVGQIVTVSRADGGSDQ